MTREEAIQVLAEINATLKSWSGFTEYPQAIDMAIEALSKVDTTENPKCLMSHEEAWAEIETKHGRLIDADALEFPKLLKRVETEADNAYNEGIVDTILCIKSAPTIATPYQPYTDIEAIKGEAEKGDLISREDAIEAVKRICWNCSNTICHNLINELSALPSAEPTAEEVWSVAQKVFYSTLTYREAVDYLKEVEGQHERFNQKNTESALPRKDDAMGAVQDHFNADGFKGYDDGQKMMDRIKELPSADRPHGEWIFDTDIPIGGGRTSAGYVCSNCRKDYFRVDGFNFCPNCGARMKGGEDE